MATALSLLVALAVLGFVVWILVTFVPMPEPYKRLVLGVAILIVVILVLRWTFGIGTGVIWPY